jgi:hypothetical protein
MNSGTADTLAPLIRDLLIWLSPAPRPYAEVMDIWRTSCPRLTVWEDAVDAGLVAHLDWQGYPAMVEVTERGKRLLSQ